MNSISSWGLGFGIGWLIGCFTGLSNTMPRFMIELNIALCVVVIIASVALHFMIEE